jgi:predicted HNH restriction endonuclease
VRPQQAARLAVSVICGFNFRTTFGPLAEGFIHVHHLPQLSDIRTEYVVDPIADLRPVCPNCHAVIHLGGQLRSIEEVKLLLALQRKS